jgi:hypothetical protein
MLAVNEKRKKNDGVAECIKSRIVSCMSLRSMACEKKRLQPEGMEDESKETPVEFEQTEACCHLQCV